MFFASVATSPIPSRQVACKSAESLQWFRAETEGNEHRRSHPGGIGTTIVSSPGPGGAGLQEGDDVEELHAAGPRLDGHAQAREEEEIQSRVGAVGDAETDAAGVVTRAKAPLAGAVQATGVGPAGTGRSRAVTSGRPAARNAAPPARSRSGPRGQRPVPTTSAIGRAHPPSGARALDRPAAAVNDAVVGILARCAP
jgi:hypothetical protein